MRAHVGARAPKEAQIQGARYDMRVFRTPDNRQVRTFYPVFLGPGSASPPVVEPPVVPPVKPPIPGLASVRIIAAMIDPPGDDAGRETVTLLNMSADPVSLTEWQLVDDFGKRMRLAEVIIRGGSATTVPLPRDLMQLPNKGGQIQLVDGAGQVVHSVRYSKADAASRGRTIVFA